MDFFKVANLQDENQLLFVWVFLILAVAFEYFWWKRVYTKGRKPLHAFLFGLPGPFRVIYEYNQGGRDWVSLAILILMPIITFLVSWGYCIKFQDAMDRLKIMRQDMSEKQLKRSYRLEQASMILFFISLIVIGVIGILWPD